MRIEQLQFFESKGDFNSRIFEIENQKFFQKLALTVSEAFENFDMDNKPEYDASTRASMLNNWVTTCISNNCSCDRFKVHKLSNTRRFFGVLGDKYLLMFKKSPISNIKTNQDDLIKNQELNKHVVFIVYNVDDFWSSIKKLEIQYYSSPNNLTYTYDITEMMNLSETRTMKPESEESKPNVKIRKELVQTKKAE